MRVEIVYTRKHLWRRSNESGAVRWLERRITPRKVGRVGDEVQLGWRSGGRTGRLRVRVKMIWGVERILRDYFVFDRTKLLVGQIGWRG